MRSIFIRCSLKRTFLSLILILVIDAIRYTNGAGRQPPPAVEINKCCRNGETLDRNKECLIGGTDKWWPLIYMIAKQAYFPKQGEAPRFLRARESKRPDCQHPELFLNNIALFSNGSLFLGERNSFIDRNDYCIDKDIALVCLPNGADSLTTSTKIRKCCSINSIYLTREQNCVPTDERPQQLFETKNISNIDFRFGFPSCKGPGNNNYVMADKFHEHNLNVDNGSYTLKNTRQILTNDEFCIDHTNQNGSMVFACDDMVTSKEISEDNTEENRRFLIYAIALIISVIFLSLTLAIGFLLPSNHHVLHCRCQTYYVGYLLFGDLLLAINQLGGSGIKGILCSAIATSMHFFFLAAFFWLNVMCLNIYLTFRDFRPTTLGKKQEKIRLRVYKIYAWGFPFLITAIAAIMDNLPDTQDVLRPRFGEKSCWFFGNMEIFVYFFGPVGMLLLINICLFASTTRQLMCGLWKQDDVKSSTERAALGRVCMKLVVVMGITWCGDVLSWAHNVWLPKNANQSPDVPFYFWYVIDTINALQGVWIFLVVASQPQVFSAIGRFFSPKSSRSKLNTAHGQHHSSSSNGLASIGESMTNHTFNTTTNASKVPMETIC
ncbi:probable G-protein coupled receptor Mth-like 1 [Contarinia nasturtii]|uniref:probable G-protein coupled receptor Mth-like 1 n=1 Tax=Contarinia nasturtii TaxID=265458 RepID=UPI0012D380FA|nr:probable G-protein coupled receptor Mth-like 1 [Contarinia nasturtii]XP_031619300.1 probable G-protein coupled receptor Mth-like 1 [Contarinia nasturtii]